MAFPDNNTVLTLSGMGVPKYSARGLQQTLVPIGSAYQQRRTINGVLRDFSGEQFRKFASTISGDDQRPPACDGVWPGQIVTVDCIVELAVQGSQSTFDRTAVPGSVYEEEGFTFYRPRLTMMVVGFNIGRREWAAAVPWSLELEEV